ncbi:MAG: AAA family ATPase [Dermatophilaceae bacterium]
MTILWDTDPEAMEAYKVVLGDKVQLVETGELVARALAADDREWLVVVGPGVDTHSACGLAARIRLQRPEVGVVLLRRRLEVAVLADALRSGIREVVSDEDLAALSAACRRSQELSQALGAGGGAGTSKGRVVTVFSAKGGVGKTTIATNLGVYLASTGSRVLLVDLDLAFGDVAVSLQLTPSRTSTDLIAMSGHLDAQGLALAVTTHESGLDTLCAPDVPERADHIQATTTAQLLVVAQSAYDFVIVDTPPTFTEHVLAAFDITDIFILMATMDIAAVKNLRLVLQTMDQLGYPRQSRVIVLNRSDVKAGIKAANVVAATGQPIAVCIPDSADVPASINRGVAIVVDQPRHPVSAALRALADDYVRPERPGALEPSHSDRLQPKPPATRRELREQRRDDGR